MIFGYTKVRPYLRYYIYVALVFACNLAGTVVVIVYVNHF
jgi:hypothetical protein